MKRSAICAEVAVLCSTYIFKQIVVGDSLELSDRGGD